jgi:pimeloyl-ACP methyl ester carboxylesterase/DNA-binding CsgD family transcriptional regulator
MNLVEWRRVFAAKIGDVVDKRPPDAFTPRELEILRLVALGLSNRDIAEELVIAPETVRWYTKQIYSKLGVHGRIPALVRAQELGLIDKSSSHSPTDVQPEISEAVQRIYFTPSFDGTSIAYAIAGNGPPLVKTATFLCHLEYDWESPIWRHWLDELTHENTLIRYDERGNGLSDWDVEDLSFDAWVRDLEAVVDVVGLRQFPLFAMSQGCTVAVAYAVRHPEKVSHLILYGGYARGWLNRDLTKEQREEEKLLIDLMRVGWGRENPAFRQVFATQLRPEATTEELSALDEQMRVSATAENAVRLESEMHRTDVRHLAPQIQIPTLVVHAREDAAVPFEEGRLLASLIPNAQFVALESKNHLLMETEPAWQKFVSAIRRFLAE